jgi:deferrochelatase/peroxidase EfeB
MARSSHPAGVAGRQAEHVVLAAFDVLGELPALLAEWAAAVSVERPWDATIGVGPSLFDGRFGLEDLRPARLHRLPLFAGDALEPERCDGDLLVMVAAELAETAAAAVDAFAGLGEGAVVSRWRQAGFLRPGRGTRRNLLGFKDGSMNPRRPWDLDRHVWVQTGERTWMVGGTYLVYRRIRFDLRGWGALDVAEQEQIVGRHKASGAPLGHTHEFDPRVLEELPPDSHIRVSAARSNGGAAMLRRGWSYTDADDDAGLLFLAYQKDPRRQFAPVMARIAEQDALRAHVTPTASAVFALAPPDGLRALASSGRRCEPRRDLSARRAAEPTRASPRPRPRRR